MSIIHASLAALALWRLDCGAIQEPDLNIYSDTDAFIGQSRRLTVRKPLVQWLGGRGKTGGSRH